MVESTKEEVKSNKNAATDRNEANNLVEATNDAELIIDTSEALEIVSTFD